MRNFGKLLLLVVKSILIFIVVGALSTASVKNIQKVVLVEEFKAKGVYQEDISSETEKFYRIDAPNERPSYTMDRGRIIPGSKGDILVATEAHLVGPIIDGIVTFFAGGHAAICTGDYGDYEIGLDDTTSIESTGLNEGENPASIFNRDYWSYSSNYKEVIGLRVKGMNDRKADEVISNAAALLGDPYNYSFLFDTTNKSYCSDLVSKAYKSIGVDLNKDDFTTSIYDLIVTSDTYISYYHYYDSNNVKHIYYFG